MESQPLLVLLLSLGLAVLFIAVIGVYLRYSDRRPVPVAAELSEGTSPIISVRLPDWKPLPQQATANDPLLIKLVLQGDSEGLRREFRIRLVEFAWVFDGLDHQASGDHCGSDLQEWCARVVALAKEMEKEEMAPTSAST